MIPIPFFLTSGIDIGVTVDTIDLTVDTSNIYRCFLLGVLLCNSCNRLVISGSNCVL